MPQTLQLNLGFVSPCTIKTPPGYSCLFVPPLNNTDDRFSIIPGIVDTDKLNFEVVPVPFRDAYPFGGALHCATTDVYRESSQEDYFTKQ